MGAMQILTHPAERIPKLRERHAGSGEGGVDEMDPQTLPEGSVCCWLGLLLAATVAWRVASTLPRCGRPVARGLIDGLV
jgi:hypothetical protein